MSNTTETWIGHQLRADDKMLSCVHGLLNDALMVLGTHTEFVELKQKIESAAQDAHNLATAAKDVYEDAA